MVLCKGVVGRGVSGKGVSVCSGSLPSVVERVIGVGWGSTGGLEV